jgi:predicted PurR-regulated permease PerM
MDGAGGAAAEHTEAAPAVEPGPGRIQIDLSERQQRLLDTFLILATIAAAFIVLGFLDNAFKAFQDIIILFFLAWLLSFALLPLINLVARLMPRAPRAAAVVVVYSAIAVIFLALVVQLAASVGNSIAEFIRTSPQLETQLRMFLRAVAERLAAIGFSVELESQAPVIIQNLNGYAQELAEPIQQVAFASIGLMGNLLILVMLSLYIAIDRGAILAFLFRLVPPNYLAEARLLQVSVGRSFGGFLRGQVVMGVSYGAVAAVANITLGLPYGAATAVTSGLLHMIPFFGPFVSWLPPVAVALLLQPESFVPTLVIMGVGWFVTMNILQPRLMSGAVGIHPIVVLGSVLIGSKIAGIMGAIFGIPIAAVVSAFFFHFYARSRESGSVTDRATQRVAAREGRAIRKPREPVAGLDADVEDRGNPEWLTAPPSPAAEHAAGDPGADARAPGAGPRVDLKGELPG